MRFWAPQRLQGIVNGSQACGRATADGDTFLSRRGFLQRSAALLAALPLLPGFTNDPSPLLSSEESLLNSDRELTRGELADPFSEAEDLVADRREPGCLFLTFDDGPLYCTSSILDRLAERKQKATFFVIGRNLMQPILRKLAIRAIQEGHEIGNHSFTHPPFSELTSQRVEQEIAQTHKQITALFKEAGIKDRSQRFFFRFPYGDAGSGHNYYASMNLLAELGYSVAWWDVDTHDWRMTSSKASSARARVIASFGRARSRDVVLLHDRKGTADILPSLLDVMKSKSLVSMCLSAYDGTASEHRTPREVYENPADMAPEPSFEPDASEPLLPDELLWEDDETDDSVSGFLSSRKLLSRL